MVRTDQRSLRHLLQQPSTTPAQQNWVGKLLGYDFDIVYKAGSLNGAANALSRRDDELRQPTGPVVYTALSLPAWVDWTRIHEAELRDPALAKVHTALTNGQPTSSSYYSLINGQLFYKGCIVVPRASEWAAKLITEFHSTSSGTYRRVAASVYWPGMMCQSPGFIIVGC